MKRLLVALCVGVLSFGLVAGNAEAKRSGGGKPAGMQRDSVTQKPASPQPTAPTQNTSAPLAAAESFDEVWKQVKPSEGDRGWQVAGIQQLS
jgi:hypothetical protein